MTKLLKQFQDKLKYDIHTYKLKTNHYFAGS